jgi:hypothetical protein
VGQHASRLRAGRTLLLLLPLPLPLLPLLLVVQSS